MGNIAQAVEQKTQIIDGMEYPFNKYRDEHRDFSPCVILPNQKDGYMRIRVFNYTNGLHYELSQPLNEDNLFGNGQEVICFDIRTQLESERNHGSFLQWADTKKRGADPIRLTISHVKDCNSWGKWYVMLTETWMVSNRPYNLGYCWKVDRVINPNK